MKSRQNILDAVRGQPEIDALIIGGGVNGIGTYRDLALQGLRVLLVEKSDYCSGASAASSHMLHGGIRYLENGEFRLVREALHERNRMLKNAPHYSKPLPTVIPIFKWASGFLNAPLKFLGLLDRPSERGAVVIKLGLMLYDAFTGSEQTMPFHKMRGRKESLKAYPHLNPDIVASATYYDAGMSSPERICIDLLRDADAANDQAFSLNYAPVVGATANSVSFRDEIGGETYTVKPKVVINAAGPWIDLVNGAMQRTSRFIGGTKGSHIIVDHPQLLEATGGAEVFFENSDGRIVLILPFMKFVMIGTTDIKTDTPENIICTDEEVTYMLDLVKKVFPNITVERSQIVYQFSGVRPLPANEEGRTGAISRDHQIQTMEAGDGRAFPVYSLVGGKWTTFRAFSEQTTDLVLNKLNRHRAVNTAHLAIGGGKDFPTSEPARLTWLDTETARSGLPRARVETLLNRYGTVASAVAAYIAQESDAPLTSLPTFSRREIAFVAQQEHVVHLDDFLMRRSLIAMQGELKLHPDSIAEIASILGAALGWSEAQVQEEIERTDAILKAKHGFA